MNTPSEAVSFTPPVLEVFGLNQITLSNDDLIDCMVIVHRSKHEAEECACVYGTEDNEALAERIVLCVNSHDALLAACKRALAFSSPRPYQSADEGELCEILESAIRKATLP